MGQDANSNWGRRVALLVQRDLHHVQIAAGECDDADYLLSTGRWQEIRVPMENGASMFVATIYGYPGAGHDENARLDNENLLAHAILRQK